MKFSFIWEIENRLINYPLINYSHMVVNKKIKTLFVAILKSNIAQIKNGINIHDNHKKSLSVIEISSAISGITSKVLKNIFLLFPTKPKKVLES